MDNSYLISRLHREVEIPFAQTNARYVRLWETSLAQPYGTCTEADVYIVSCDMNLKLFSSGSSSTVDGIFGGNSSVLIVAGLRDLRRSPRNGWLNPAFDCRHNFLSDKNIMPIGYKGFTKRVHNQRLDLDNSFPNLSMP